MTTQHTAPCEYHLQFFGPLKNEYVDWPEGSVSVYQINGDQIACRTIFKDQLNPRSEVLQRHSWCGYIGCFNSLSEAMVAIEKDRKEQKEQAARRNAREAKQAA